MSASFATPAWAQRRATAPQLRIDDCRPSAISVSETEAMTLLELGAEARDERSPLELWAHLDCSNGIHAQLTVTGAGQTLHRVISLSDATGSARSRVLALALAEQARSIADLPIEAGSSSPSSTRPTAAEPVAAPKPAAAKPPDASREPKTNRPLVSEPKPAVVGPSEVRERVELGASAQVRAFMATRDLAWGGAIQAHWLAWNASAEALFGARTVDLGRIDFGVAAACLGFDLLSVDRRSVRVRLVPSVAAGATWLRGTEVSSGFEARDVTRFYADARLVLIGDLHLSSVTPTLGVQTGLAHGLAATRRDRTLATTGGWFLGAQLGARF